MFLSKWWVVKRLPSLSVYCHFGGALDDGLLHTIAVAMLFDLGNALYFRAFAPVI